MFNHFLYTLLSSTAYVHCTIYILLNIMISLFLKMLIRIRIEKKMIWGSKIGLLIRIRITEPDL